MMRGRFFVEIADSWHTLPHEVQGVINLLVDPENWARHGNEELWEEIDKVIGPCVSLEARRPFGRQSLHQALAWMANRRYDEVAGDNAVNFEEAMRKASGMLLEVG